MISGVFREGKGGNAPLWLSGVEIIKNSNDDQGSFYFLLIFIENETRGDQILDNEPAVKLGIYLQQTNSMEYQHQLPMDDSVQFDTLESGCISSTPDCSTPIRQPTPINQRST